MNYNRNKKLKQITPETLVVGIDIAKGKHVARAVDDRGYEFGRKVVFDNNISGFERLMTWANEKMADHGKTHILLGCEPTGHYWFNLAHWAKENHNAFVVVNPMHVKKAKEFDDNSPSKNDTKDAHVIAQLIKDGRYAVPNLPEGVYAELREGMKIRDQLSSDIQMVEGRIDNWLDRYFPEFRTVFKSWRGKAALYTLEHFPLPGEITAMTAEEILEHWQTVVQRAVGKKKAETLQKAAKQSVGLTKGTRMGKRELGTLLQQYHQLQHEMADTDEAIKGLVFTIPGAKEMTAIKGINVMTVANFFAEVGDITQFEHPQQIQNLGGLTLRLHQSGVYKGETKITKRGRKGLRKTLYLAARSLVLHNPYFRKLHDYYKSRSDHPLKPKESLIALCSKLIRVFFVIGTKQCKFDGEKMLSDIPQMCTQEAA
ncbi:IS110 family transposase [Lentibacillus jeotgali]|nr:IS110 family transposase [Lentibacillus jeotgali]